MIELLYQEKRLWDLYLKDRNKGSGYLFLNKDSTEPIRRDAAMIKVEREIGMRGLELRRMSSEFWKNNELEIGVE